MELRWWGVVIVALVALATCVVAALLRPIAADRRQVRLLANTDRLTRLPEYRRVVRRRAMTAGAMIALLTTAFSASVIAAARPTGLPAARKGFVAAQPEDIMLCVGGTLADPAVRATLLYFSDRVRNFSTERIAVTSINRRVVPMTRDYQYVASRLGDYATATEAQIREWAPTISYSDYVGDVADVLALCLTGFPGFDRTAQQRRSMIYVGPSSLRALGEGRAHLFTVDNVREMASAAGVQVNVIVTGPTSAELNSLASHSGGIAASGDADISGILATIRSHRPQPASAQDTATVRSMESPDGPLLVALFGLSVVILWSAAVRR